MQRLAVDRKEEEGVTLVLVTASLLFIFGMATIVVDGGLGWSERRQAQSAADFSALAAVQFSDLSDPLAECPSTMSPLEQATCRGAEEAIDVVNGNLPAAGITEGDWVMECEDDEAFAVLATLASGEVECISFSETTQDARVRVPLFGVSTSFGRVLGMDLLNVSAFAEVHASLPEAYRVLPFGIPDSAGTFDCLKEGPNPAWGVCYEGGTNGNYGYLNIPTYGNQDMGTMPSPNCTTTNNELLSNMIRGVDHPLGSHATGTRSAATPGLADGKNPAADSIDVCPIFGTNANDLYVQPGVVQSIFEDGMTYGYGSTERGPLWGALHWREQQGGTPDLYLDDSPLWNYLTDWSWCAGKPTNTQQMVDCLSGWSSANGVIFSESIAQNSRYAFSPKFFVDFSSAGWYLVEELKPIYLNTTYWGCDASPACEGIHAPGDPGPNACTPPPSPYDGTEPADSTCGDFPIKGTHNLNAVTSFKLERGMLPAKALEGVPADGPLLNLALTR